MSMKFFAPKPTGINKAFQTALFAAKEQILSDCNKYVRVDQGTMRDTSYTEEGDMTLMVVWDTPYAKKVYYTGTPSPDINSEAALMWAKKAADEFGDDWRKIIEKGMKDL